MKLEIQTASSETSIIECCTDVWERLAEYRDAFLFTDETVFSLYRDRIEGSLSGARYAMAPGEAHKTQETLFALLEEMAKAGLRRGSTLIALGGGVVGDIGGLAAGLYMRGISCVQVPTTLLAQVDSSVGGKTAIDFCGVKNLVGLFRQPARVYADPSFFATLPVRELRCGLGEIVKHGALDGGLFDTLAVNRDRLFDLAFLADIVPRNIAFKADVVRRDPHETGLRKCLNLGHTTGHAFELSGDLSHGESVLVGILCEAELAKRHLSCDTAYLEELKGLCRAVLGREVKVAASAEGALLDKKNERRGEVVCTVPVAKGKYALLALPYETYARELAEIGEAIG